MPLYIYDALPPPPLPCEVHAVYVCVLKPSNNCHTDWKFTYVHVTGRVCRVPVRYTRMWCISIGHASRWGSGGCVCRRRRQGALHIQPESPIDNRAILKPSNNWYTDWKFTCVDMPAVLSYIGNVAGWLGVQFGRVCCTPAADSILSPLCRRSRSGKYPGSRSLGRELTT